MGGARALIASLGASISLVSGAALSLLVVSFLFAFDGLPGRSDDSKVVAALFVPAQPPAAGPSRAERSRGAGAVVLRPPAPRPARDVVLRRSSSTGLRPGSTGDETHPPTPGGTGVADLGPVADPPTGNPADSGPASGDGVRELGDSVTTTVADTGEAAGNATALLGPPVSQAVQDVLNVVDSLLKGATNGLAGRLDTALPR